MRLENDPDLIRDLLTPRGMTPTWAVVGLGPNPGRAAYGVSRWLIQDLGFEVVPVHPTAATVHDRQAYPTLADLPDGPAIDVVDCFVNSARVGAVVDQAIEQRARLRIGAVWMQLGVVDEDAAARARAAGLAVVMDTCPRIEYPRLRADDGPAVVAG